MIAVTNVSGSTWTVTRGSESTTPVAHLLGFTVYQVVTAGAFTQIRSTDWLNVVTMFGADPTGAADSTTAIQDALNAIPAGGGVVYVPSGTYKVSSTLTAGSITTLQGDGSSTVLSAAGTSFSGSYMIELANPASTYQVAVRDLYLIPGTLSGSTLSGPGGIQIDNTGWSGGTTTIIGDTLHTLENVTVFNAGGDGFHFDNHVREMRVRGCKNYRSAGYGFYIGPGTGSGGCTDSHFTDCTSGFAENHGFYVAGSNNMFTACKSFASGNNYYSGAIGTTECGFEITGSNASVNVFDGCSAQQNGLHGFDLQSVQQVAVVGCESDSNGAGSGVTIGAGININTAVSCTIIGCTGYQFLTPGAQAYGIRHEAGTSTGTWIGMNSVTGTVVSFQFVAGSGYNLVGALTTDFSNVTSQFRTGIIEMFPATIQALSNGNTITPAAHFGTYPVSLTGAVTGIILAAGTNGGQQVAVVNTSASNSVTFAASGTSHVADGTSDVIQPLQAATYTWDANTSLWYPL